VTQHIRKRAFKYLYTKKEKKKIFFFTNIVNALKLTVKKGTAVHVHAMMAYRRRNIAPVINLTTRGWGDVTFKPLSLYLQGKNPGTH
jgi:hypothetical protein